MSRAAPSTIPQPSTLLHRRVTCQSRTHRSRIPNTDTAEHSLSLLVPANIIRRQLFKPAFDLANPPKSLSSTRLSPSRTP